MKFSVGDQVIVGPMKRPGVVTKAYDGAAEKKSDDYYELDGQPTKYWGYELRARQP